MFVSMATISSLKHHFFRWKVKVLLLRLEVFVNLLEEQMMRKMKMMLEIREESISMTWSPESTSSSEVFSLILFFCLFFVFLFSKCWRSWFGSYKFLFRTRNLCQWGDILWICGFKQNFQIFLKFFYVPVVGRLRTHWSVKWQIRTGKRGNKRLKRRLKFSTKPSLSLLISATFQVLWKRDLQTLTRYW